MTKHVYILFSLLLLLQNAYSFEAYVVNNKFYAPKIGSYVETELLIPASKLKFVKNNNGKFQSQIEVTLLYKKNNEIITYDKYLLNSVELSDSTKGKLSLIDKKRFVLKPGAYTMDAILVDINSNEEKVLSETFILDEPSENLSISDITFIDQYAKSDENNLYTKNGFYLAPYVLNYFPENVNKLTFYSEIYNTQIASANGNVEVNYSINRYKTNDVAANLKKTVNMKSNAVNVVFSEFNIELLPSGNYEVVIEVKNDKDELLAIKKTFFQRSKEIEAAPITTEQFQNIEINNSFVAEFSEAEMKYQYRTLMASANSNEKKTMQALLKNNNLTLMKQYFLNYWTAQNPQNPKAAWEKYQALIDEVNNLFLSCVGKGYGFETDRGRVYMQYGKPNQRQARTFDPENYPHEIWQYYETNEGKQNNVRFVFVNREYGCENYKLIHSTALGEIYNNQWPSIVVKGPSNNRPEEYYDMREARPFDTKQGSRINTMYQE
jgi:GWxTD domain-containing protein